MNALTSGNINTLIAGGIFMLIVFLISFIRNMETKRLRNRLGEGNILLSSFNVHFYGVESVPGIPFNSIGAMGMSADGLYYCSRFLKKELFIPGKMFSSITVTDDFKGKNMYGNVVVFNFINDKGERDRAAFRIPYPERWSNAVNQVFLNKKPGAGTISVDSLNMGREQKKRKNKLKK